MKNSVKNINNYSSKDMPCAAPLYYRPAQNGAPCFTGMGRGVVAQKIPEAAAENDIPIIYNSELLGLLPGLDIGQPIPETALGVVAETYTFLLEMDE
jgi:flagellar biosynthesis protein